MNDDLNVSQVSLIKYFSVVDAWFIHKDSPDQKDSVTTVPQRLVRVAQDRPKRTSWLN